MKRFKNKEIIKILKKQTINLIISLVFLFISISLIATRIYLENKAKKASIYLNNVIENLNNRPNVYSNLNLYAIETFVAESTLNKDLKIYIVSDDKHYFLATMNSKLYNKIKAHDFTKGPYKIYGLSTKVDANLKKIIMDAYSEEDFTDQDFYNLYGGVYIDTSYSNKAFPILLILGIFSLIISIGFLIKYIISKTKINRDLKRINDNDLKRIETELKSSDTLKYPENKLFLTKNYIINLNKGLKVITYDNIIWAYENLIKGKGKNKNILLMNKDGILITVANFKNNDENEAKIINILTKINEKNKDILIGFSSENLKKAQAKIKEKINK